MHDLKKESTLFFFICLFTYTHKIYRTADNIYIMSKASCCNETEIVTENGIEVKGSWHNIVLSDQIKESTNKHQQQQLYQAQEKGRGWGD